MTEHPITPPPELVEQLESAVDLHQLSFSQAVARAYAAGADQELAVCCEWVSTVRACWMRPESLRTARRPKPPSLKQQALDGLRAIECNVPQSQRAFEDSCEHIRRALEALPE